MQKEFLQVKVQNLSDEARYIAKKEKWAKKAIHRKQIAGKSAEFFEKLRADLYNHRTNEVRRESRASHLAYGFLRGVPYRAMELFPHQAIGSNKCEWQGLWKDVQRNVLAFSGLKYAGDNVKGDMLGKLQDWLRTAPTIEMVNQHHNAKLAFMNSRNKLPHINVQPKAAAASE